MISWIWRSASATAPRSGEAMDTMPTVPSSSTLMSAPVSAWMVLIILPFGPMTSPIFSIGISKLTIFGAFSPTSSRGSAIASAIAARILSRASLAWFNAPARTSAGMPSILVSSCRAVTKSAVPATLKSMSPNASSAPRMSVRVTYSPSRYTSPIAIPATAALIGTPASIIERLDEHTEAIEVEPLDDSTSETRRNVYGNSSKAGRTGTRARSASAPWPISRRFGPRMKPVSPVENGGKL